MIERRAVLRGALSLAGGGALWGGFGGPALSACLGGSGSLAAGLLWPWEGGPREEIVAMRRLNPEYDLMARLFLALALGDLAVSEPGRWKDRAIRALDAILADTDAAVADRGPAAFLLPYWGYANNRGPRRSLFVDGERLLILAVRRFLGDAPALRRAADDLSLAIREAMAGPAGSAESYPNECWTFCHSVALAALHLGAAMGDRGGIPPWTTFARRSLRDPSGMLVSSFTWDGRVRDGPEGSSIWAASHLLRGVDPELAAEQYSLARAALGRTAGGFGWAREWPVGDERTMDVDSGPLVPVLEASPSSSGLAILAARSAGDTGFERALRASLEVGAFPRDAGGRRRFLASNLVGDAVILAGTTAGPLWAAVGKA